MRIVDLPWLPDAPADFRSRCRSLSSSQEGLAHKIQALATHSLNATAAAALGKSISRLQGAGASLDPLTPFRLGVLANSTYDLVAEGFQAAAARHGIVLELALGAYDSVIQQALNPTSSVNNRSCDAVLIGVDYRWFNIGRPVFGDVAADRISAAREMLRTVLDAIRTHGGSPTILQTVPIPPISLFGSYERRVESTVRSMLEALNAEIIRLAADTGSYLLDVQALSAEIGTHTWFDPVQWHLYKLPFSSECNAIYSDMLGRLLGAIRGRSRKCLVLDLDNTIWGGVVGDDGMSALRIGSGTPEGEAFIEVQSLALDLKERGIILAVSSKNDEDTARRVFLEHPDMLLRHDDITVFQANWLDKASNLEAIAESLSIGLDSLVFLDDNPAERAQVRAALPMVAVPELPADPAWYPRFLSAAGYFEAVNFSSEDRGRSQSYRDAARRAEVLVKSRDLGDYLGSLEMKIRFAHFDSIGRSRITQLINKSNQFNLTTRRYTEAEVSALETDPEIFSLQVRLSDRFGDFGMICVVICRTVAEGDHSVWEIDTWLMSCRVLGRRVEEAVLREIVTAARKKRVTAIRGLYLPTAKNSMVADHYSKLGFRKVDFGGSDGDSYRLEIAGYAAPDLPFRIEQLL